jgi:hypothetical protein
VYSSNKLLIRSTTHELLPSIFNKSCMADFSSRERERERERERYFF